MESRSSVTINSFMIRLLKSRVEYYERKLRELHNSLKLLESCDHDMVEDPSRFAVRVCTKCGYLEYATDIALVPQYSEFTTPGCEPLEIVLIYESDVWDENMMRLLESIEES